MTPAGVSYDDLFKALNTYKDLADAEMLIWITKKVIKAKN